MDGKVSKKSKEDEVGEVISYSKKETFFHRLNPLVKVVFLFSLVIASILFPVLLIELLLFFLVLLLIISTRLPLKEIVKFAFPFVFLAPFIVALQAFLYPIKEGFLFEFMGFQAFHSGLLFGIAIAFRLLIIGFTVPLLFMTTKPGDLINSSRRFLPGFLAFGLTITFRFIPIFEEELHKIRIAQEARAVNTRKPQSLVTLIVPLFLKALKRSRTMAYSVESRGFGAE